MIAEIDDASFDDEIAGGPCALLFSSPWCGTCSKVAARVEAAWSRNSGVKVCKMDATRNVRTVSRLNVLSIPTIIFFKDGKEKNRLSGDMTEREVSEGMHNIL